MWTMTRKLILCAFLLQQLSAIAQRGDAACVLGTVADHENFPDVFNFNLFVVGSFQRF
jgi:hypothetical protein